MLDTIKKAEAELSGVVKGFSRFHDHESGKIVHEIIIECEAMDSTRPVEARFNYSNRWNRLGLKKGDKVSFTATIKTNSGTTDHTQKESGSWKMFSIELFDFKDLIEIQNPRQIIKLGIDQ